MGIVGRVVGLRLIGIIRPAHLQLQQVHIYCDIPVNVSRYIHRVNIVDATVIVLGLRNLRRPDIQGKVSDRDAVQHIAGVGSHGNGQLLTGTHTYGVGYTGSVGQLVTVDGHRLSRRCFPTQSSSTGIACGSGGIGFILHGKSGSEFRLIGGLSQIQNDIDIHIPVLHLKGELPHGPGAARGIESVSISSLRL